MQGFTQKRIVRHDSLDEDNPYLQADIFLMKRVQEAVDKDYPGHPWLVEASHIQGVIMISLPLFSNRHGTEKFVIPLRLAKSDPLLRCVKNACGEMLERLNLPRTGFSGTEFLSALERAPIHKRGRHGLFQQ